MNEVMTNFVKIRVWTPVPLLSPFHCSTHPRNAYSELLTTKSNRHLLLKPFLQTSLYSYHGLNGEFKFVKHPLLEILSLLIPASFLSQNFHLACEPLLGFLH